MAYHGGQKKTKTKKTKQKKGQKKSNVQTTVKNVGGRFQAQTPTQTVDDTRGDTENIVQQMMMAGASAESMYQQTQAAQEETQEQTNAEQMVQQMMTAGASAESMYQQTQAAQQETQEQAPTELSGTLVMPTPASNTWVVQDINEDINFYHIFHFANPFSQASSSIFFSLNVSTGCQKPLCI